MREFLTVFLYIFLAELGDKTQLTALGLSATQGNKLRVFASASLALVLSTALAVFLGGEVFRRVDPALIRKAAGLLFVLLGLLTLFRP